MKLYIIKYRVRYEGSYIEAIYQDKKKAEDQLKFLIAEQYYDDYDGKPYIQEYITTD